MITRSQNNHVKLHITSLLPNNRWPVRERILQKKSRFVDNKDNTFSSIMTYLDKEDRAVALRAVLDMIDSKEYDLETRKEREAALQEIIDVNKLTYWTGTGKNRKRLPYPTYKLFEFVNQLVNHLKDGVKQTAPKSDIIWQSGTSVIKSEYLKKHLHYEILLATDTPRHNTHAQSPDQSKPKIVPKVCM